MKQQSHWSRRALLGAFTAVLTFGLAGCGADEDEDALASARKAWEAARPTRYQFHYTETGFSPLQGTWRIEVDGQQAVSVTSVGGDSTWELSVESAPTVEALFEEVERNLDSSGTRVEVSYDSTWHHPVDARFSKGEEASGFRAEAFTPLD